MNSRPSVLMVSKFEQVQGGVEVHIRDLRYGLESLGWDSDIFSVNDLPSSAYRFDAEATGPMAKISSVKSLVWNSAARVALREKVREYKPDLIHYHSIYHQLSPSVLDVADIPTVMTLHDFKLVAPCYTLVRDGAHCELCVESRTNFPSVRYRCVKDSAAASVVCAAETSIFQRRYIDSVEKFIVPSTFSRSVISRGGLSENKMAVIPWGIAPMSEPAKNAATRYGRYWVFTGRLHPAKGIVELLQAWQDSDRPDDLSLVIAGDGELRHYVDAYARSDPSVTVVGFVGREHLMSLLLSAEACVVPSVQPETMGLSAIESLVAGVPLISSGAGALSDLAGGGVIDMGTDSKSWAAHLSKLAVDGSILTSARERLDERDLSAFGLEEMCRRIADVYYSAMPLSTTSS